MIHRDEKTTKFDELFKAFVEHALKIDEVYSNFLIASSKCPHNRNPAKGIINMFSSFLFFFERISALISINTEIGLKVAVRAGR